MVNFGLLAAEIDPVVWGIPANFNGFRVLVALLQSSSERQPNCGVEQRAPPLFGIGRPSGLALTHILVLVLGLEMSWDARAA